MGSLTRDSSICAWVLLVMASGAFAFVAYTWLSYSPPVGALRFAFSGNWFRNDFSQIHAGMHLDQPTVGKFLLWCSLLAYLGCATIVLLRLAVGAARPIQRYCVTACAALIAVLVLVEFLAPTLLIVQYVLSMGITLRRFVGLCICGSLWILLPALVVWVGKADLLGTKCLWNPFAWISIVTLITPMYYTSALLGPPSSQSLASSYGMFILGWLVLTAPMLWVFWTIADGKIVRAVEGEIRGQRKRIEENSE